MTYVGDYHDHSSGSWSDFGDMLDELRVMRADLEHLIRSPSPPSFDDGL